MDAGATRADTLLEAMGPDLSVHDGRDAHAGPADPGGPIASDPSATATADVPPAAIRPRGRRGSPRFTYGRFLRTAFDCADPAAFRLCGMDEVGRGAFAGPLVAAAAVLPHRFRHPLLRDSKLLTAEQREVADAAIRRAALAVHVVQASAAEINERGIGWANVEVFRRLVDLVEADGYCADGNLRIRARRPVQCVIGGDRLVPAISAASIVAKVHRDALMRRLHAATPQYEWASNKGYGAPEHRAALLIHGPHAEHRALWVRHWLEPPLLQAMTAVAGDGLDAVAAAGAPGVEA